MEIAKTRFYIFGSYLKNLNYNDIDVLVVIPRIENINMINENIHKLSIENPMNIVHVQIYLSSEYYNIENKFSYEKVNHEISSDEFIKLYKIRPTTAST
ncbi:nucleotidyltransferase domain-containing protein [Treponema zuelzerae]|uniref:Nucleotidyltransferase domain-containing protein n=1 Tax=Teretinema zuelzerae TaxID=156 RepID=A0AAE3EJB3_9SPIR|nr:nucleotidyltransferase domain-containing protein [Teretinema zuelzerae]MCD1656045.1 nucleotidyltransferase domain-containing protein [Teretinema zuelzerae]